MKDNVKQALTQSEAVTELIEMYAKAEALGLDVKYRLTLLEMIGSLTTKLIGFSLTEDPRGNG